MVINSIYLIIEIECTSPVASTRDTLINDVLKPLLTVFQRAVRRASGDIVDHKTMVEGCDEVVPWWELTTADKAELVVLGQSCSDLLARRVACASDLVEVAVRGHCELQEPSTNHPYLGNGDEVVSRHH